MSQRRSFVFRCLAAVSALHCIGVTVLRMDRTMEGERVVMTLSGDVALGDVAGLRRLLEAEAIETLIVDLGDVIQVPGVLSRLQGVAEALSERLAIAPGR